MGTLDLGVLHSIKNNLIEKIKEVNNKKMEIEKLTEEEIIAKDFKPIITDNGTYYTHDTGDTNFVAIDDRSKHRDVWGYRDGKRMQKDEAERHINKIFNKDEKGDSTITTTKDVRFGERADVEAQKIREEQGLTSTPEATVKEDLTVPELIAKYIDILAQVTVAVKAEERIPDREKGYAVKFIYYSVKGAMENGGDREEE